MFASSNRKISLNRCGLVTCIIFATASLANAQDYQQIEPTVTGGAAKQLRAAATSALRDATNYQAKKQSVQQYFTQVYFPGMTNVAPASLGLLEKKREVLLRTLRSSKVPAAQKQITELTFKAMHRIARGNYHPAVRYNAVLILGDLDRKVAGSGSGATPPVPLADATQSLLEILGSDRFEGVPVPASLKLGALVGLERHARFGIDQEDAEKLTRLALNLVAQEKPFEDVTLEVHHWMKCQAAGVLTRLYVKNITPEVHRALTTMINDQSMSIEDRCCVANLLARVDYQGVGGIDGSATVAALGNLMKQIAKEEAKFAREYEETKIGRRGGRSGRSLVEPSYQRARLALRLRSIALGARSLTKGLSGQGKEQLNRLVASLAPVMAIAQEKDSVDLKVTRAVRKLENAVNAEVDSWKKDGDAEDADFS